ncbi:MAG: glycoside hydrolase family 92 protein [Chitinophagaceae bacterium]|nr:MAG: glycoside hydrolase family 92 protein [Chitinophagaceae bacterium]
MKLQFVLCFCLLVSSRNVYGGTGNIAGQARVTVSTDKSGQEGSKATDGVIAVDGAGEWACEGVTTDWGYIRFPWIRLDWEDVREINRVVLYDRASLTENIAGGKLLFSDGSVVWVNQLPADGAGKSVSFPAKKISWVKFVVTDGTGSDLGLSEIEVYPTPDQAGQYVSWVDPYIETNRGRDIFFITGSTPFGLASSAPMTRNKNQNGGAYNYNETEILGFEQIHAWMVMGFELMPATVNENPALGQQGWKSKFSHDDEIVQPGYHRVFLRNHAIWAEQTATERVNFYRFTYTKDTKARIIVNLAGYVSNNVMTNAEVTKVSNREIQGSFSTVNRFWGGPKDVKIFFVARFDKDFNAMDAWNAGAEQENVSNVTGDSLTVALAYDLKKGERVNMKIGLSYTTIENARANLDSECPAWDFDAVRKQTQDTWNEWLGRIAVKGGMPENWIKFYTDLWHVLLGRQKINDVNGDYPDRTTGKRDGNFTDAVFKIKRVPMNSEGKPAFNMYSSDAFWLSQWNLNVLWGLAWPEVMDDFAASLIEYADNGYLLPRGPSGGGYSYIMTSCPASNLIESAYMKGLLRKSDPLHAYEVIRRNHLPGGMLGDAADIKFYTKNGYWPDNVGITIEASFQDWGIAQMAAKLGRKKDYNFFMKRSAGWVKSFEPNQKLLFPLDRRGKFMHTDPLSGAGWVEANAWQGTWGLSHALPELIVKMGGEDSFTSKLNYAFEQSRESDFVFGYTDGYVSYANQPGCSNAHVFSYAGKPWLTQYWVRRVRDQAYGAVTPDMGYGGHDEDQGQMGGVSALMSIGLFNIKGNQSQTPVYEITTPIFDEVKIKLDKKYYTGDTFVIKSANNSGVNDYIQSATLNGKELNTFWFTHDAFSKGGVLELQLGKSPNKSWGTGGLPE